MADQWDGFDKYPENECECRCGTNFRSHSRYSMTRGLVSRRPCPDCGHDDLIRRASADVEQQTIGERDVSHVRKCGYVVRGPMRGHGGLRDAMGEVIVLSEARAQQLVADGAKAGIRRTFRPVPYEELSDAQQKILDEG